jgi:S1-C subfamily serine protease
MPAPSKMHHFRPWSFNLGLLLLACLAGCKSQTEKLDELLRTEQYSQARALLEEEGVGASLTPKADAKSLALRDSFTREVEGHYSRETQISMAAGRARKALELAHEGAGLCPWSVSLQESERETQSRVAEVDRVQQHWTGVLNEPGAAAADARKFLVDLKMVHDWIADSPIVTSLRESASRILIADWAHTIETRGIEALRQNKSQMLAELAQCNVETHSTDLLKDLVESLGSLPLIKEGVPTHLQTSVLDQIAALSAALAEQNAGKKTEALSPCYSALRTCFIDWSRHDLATVVSRQDVTFAELNGAEAVLELDVDHTSALRSATAQGHLRRAKIHSGEGVAAILSLAHLARARELGLPSTEASASEVEALALSSVSATPLPARRLVLDLSPQVDPRIYGLVFMAFSDALRSEPSALSTMSVVRQGSESQARVLVSEAQFVFDTTSLHSVQSEYFSHFQDVPNTRKTYLKSQVESDRFSMNLAESSYNSSVSSYNIYPTQYSLNNMNWAYNRYSVAVNNFNATVDAYNATPSTISQPVYLPYSFTEGHVQFGWKANVECSVESGKHASAPCTAVLSDNVRLGTKYSDKSELYRRDDPLDIDVSAESSIKLLDQVVKTTRDALNPLLVEIHSSKLAQLSAEESMALGWLLHPWGIQADLGKALGLRSWLIGCGANLHLPAKEGAVPPHQLSRSPESPLHDLSAQDASASLDRYACLIEAGDGHVEIGSGSGALISDEGLVLTCSHVLVGPELSITFTSGPWKGKYQGEVVYVNEQHDAALIHARDLHNSSWAHIRLSSDAIKGEPIIAIGSPGLEQGVLNVGGVTAGIVSNLQTSIANDEALVADITIASGSSGGPLFALSDGAIVGIVRAVAVSPGINPEGPISATGYICLAVPSAKLPKWLGLIEPH